MLYRLPAVAGAEIEAGTAYPAPPANSVLIDEARLRLTLRKIKISGPRSDKEVTSPTTPLCMKVSLSIRRPRWGVYESSSRSTALLVLLSLLAGERTSVAD